MLDVSSRVVLTFSTPTANSNLRITIYQLEVKTCNIINIPQSRFQYYTDVYKSDVMTIT